MFIYFMISIMPLLTVLRRREGFDQGYVKLCFFYVNFFFLFPFAYFYSSGRLQYLGKVFYADSSVILFCVFSFFLFVLGFLSIDVFKVFFKVKARYQVFFKHADNEFRSVKRKYFFVVSFFIMLLYKLYLLFTSQSAAEERYSISQGSNSLGGAEWADLAFDMVLGGTFTGLLIVAINRRWIVLVCTVLLINFLLGAFTGAGRASLLISLVLLGMFITRLRVGSAVTCMSFGLIVMLPVVSMGKYIISQFALNGELPDFYDLFRNSGDFDFIIFNFSHPFASLLAVDELIEKVGYRYFYDFIQGFLFFFRVVGADFGYSITYYNTEVFLGAKLSIIPPGYFALGFVQLSYLGVFLVGVFYRMLGYLAKFIDRRVNFVGSSVVSMMLIYPVANSFYHGDIRIMVTSVFFKLFIILFSVSFFLKKKL